MPCLTCGREIGEHSHDTRDLCNMYIGAEKGSDVVGHKTFDTGKRDEHGLPIFRHEPLTRAEGAALWESIRAAEKDRAERMPDE